ncbi:superoxide dismutase [Haloplasma contractile]|uniref:Superoxide dismutase n=1 Tax=Haloplasma contractile SSD-17B TaxID=1033810 RepID=F7PRH7_9MOLU|nr:superoxide dismutase [Haloplasma contractile]ERJ11697.1 Superoxide dismutase Mn protein [Haloplasma contractile SSD-17B]
MSFFNLPDLPYEYDALEPNIDAKTVEIHYDRHHRGYTNKLNTALEDYKEFAEGKSIEDILGNVDAIPEAIRQKVINVGGGYLNHILYWNQFSKDGGGKPTGDLLEAINKSFGSFDSFKEELNNAAKTVFGSGWAFVVVNGNNELEIVKKANQNSPISDGVTPIIGIDVWEHAYYLNYQNKRPDYIEAVWNIFNWNEITRLYNEAIK